MITSVSTPVKDLKGKVILEANRDITDWSKRMIVSGEYLKRKSKVKDNLQLVEDMNQIFEEEPYKAILSGWTTNLREWIGEMYARAIMFEELKFQKMRDPYWYRHVLVITVVGSRMLELWVKAPVTVRKAFQALLFHDLGKTRIAPTILEKSEKLDEMEMRAIHEHPIGSYALNAAYWGDANHLCSEVALHHHEDRLGKGYPRQVKTNSLILDILGMLDRFDACISSRPFRLQKFSVRDATDMLKKDVDDGRLDGDILKAFVALIRKQPVADRKKLKLGTIGRPPKST